MPLVRDAARILTPAMALLVLAGSSACGEDIRRSQENPRKTAIYQYAYSLVERLQDQNAMGGGLGPSHPARIRSPYPTQPDFERAIGKADAADAERWDEYDSGPSGLTLYWWEPDSTWEVPRRSGEKKKGFREIIIAHFDSDGQLRVLEILAPVGFETIGRHATEWHWIG